eukprot:3187085-Pyramimonas_sp.AAC.1
MLQRSGQHEADRADSVHVDPRLRIPTILQHFERGLDVYRLDGGSRHAWEVRVQELHDADDQLHVAGLQQLVCQG